MPLKESEAIVLRSYPLREADLLVTFFTRSEGKLRGVARSALKSRKRFGGALEPLTIVRLYWEDRERRELARIDSCDVLASPLTDAVDYPRAVALGHVAEVLDELLPDREGNDAVYRLSAAVLAQLKPGAIWAALTYFDLWMVRLTGFLPELGACIMCGEALNGAPAYFHPLADGLMCAGDRRLASAELSPQSRALAAEMFRVPVERLSGREWSKQCGADLRRFLVQRIERHIEKKLVTAAMLEKL
ncbi:MAG: DNA repair protein RecO [Terriglobales bacterium]